MKNVRAKRISNIIFGGVVFSAVITATIFIYILVAEREYNANQNLASDFFKTYNERTDFEKFLSFYDENIILEDMINGDRVSGKVELAKFFNWDTPNFKPLDSLNRYVVVEDLVITDHMIIAKGYFTPFQWFDKTYEAIQYTTLLFLNNDRKIERQIDWINYPSGLVDCQTRKNSNDWINDK